MASVSTVRCTQPQKMLPSVIRVAEMSPIAAGWEGHHKSYLILPLLNL